MTDQNKQGALDVYKSAVHTIFIPLMFVALAAMGSWMNKMEDRQYVLQREAVTEQKLNVTEQRIMNHMDIRLRDLDSKMNLVIRQLEQINSRDSNR